MSSSFCQRATSLTDNPVVYNATPMQDKRPSPCSQISKAMQAQQQEDAIANANTLQTQHTSSSTSKTIRLQKFINKRHPPITFIHPISHNPHHLPAHPLLIGIHIPRHRPKAMSWMISQPRRLLLHNSLRNLLAFLHR